MNDLERLKEDLLLKNKNLLEQKDKSLKKYKNITLNDNILLNINLEFIGYLKSIVNDLTLNDNEIDDVNFTFQFYDTISSLNIDLNNLFHEDKNIIRFKDTIKLLIKKINELRTFVSSNIDLEINNNNKIINNISKIIDIYNSTEINLELVFDLINELPLEDNKKENIFKEIYNKQLEILRNLNKSNVIKFEIIEEDEKLKLGCEKLLNNLKKIKGKIQSNKENIADIVLINNLYNRVFELNEKVINYFNDKNTSWEENEFNKEELEEEFNNLYQGLTEELSECTNNFNKIYDRYKKMNNIETLELDEIETFEEYPPIIYWFGNNELISDDNYQEIDKIFEEFDNYPEDNFYKGKLKPALELLKKHPHFVELKQNGIENNKIETVVGISNAVPFRELKLRPGKGGTARVYYDTIKTNLGKKYIVIYMITNKHDNYDKLNYQQVERYLKSKRFSQLPTLLDDPSVIEKFREIEQVFLEKINEKVSKEVKVGGSK